MDFTFPENEVEKRKQIENCMAEWEQRWRKSYARHIPHHICKYGAEFPLPIA